MEPGGVLLPPPTTTRAHARARMAGFGGTVNEWRAATSHISGGSALSLYDCDDATVDGL